MQRSVCMTAAPSARRLPPLWKKQEEEREEGPAFVILDAARQTSFPHVKGVVDLGRTSGDKKKKSKCCPSEQVCRRVRGFYKSELLQK